jgi:hypothetical protein
VADELDQESQNAFAQQEIPLEEGDSEEAELDEIAQSMGQAQEAEMGNEPDKKSRTSEENKEIG